jgi:hypothetical protein
VSSHRWLHHRTRPLRGLIRVTDGPAPLARNLIATKLLACWVQAEIVDMHSVAPSSQGKLAGLWVTQDTLVTGNTEKTNFQTFNLKTQKWTDLGPKNLGNIVNWMISPDGKYLSFTTEGAEPNVERIRLADQQVEPIASLKGFHRVLASETTDTVAPDGSPVFTATPAIRKSTP